jgi:hypothetical protein
MLKNGHVPPQQEILKSPAQSQGGNLMWVKADNIITIKDNLPFGGLIDAGNQVEDGGLACTVGSDQTSDLAGFNI